MKENNTISKFMVNEISKSMSHILFNMISLNIDYINPDYLSDWARENEQFIKHNLEAFKISLQTLEGDK